MANGHGGRRTGSGSKKGQIYQPTQDKLADQRKADAILRAEVLKRWPEICGAQADLAAGGFHLLVKTADGWRRAVTEQQIDAALASGEEFYRLERQPAVTAAFVALSDRAFDKPVERTETKVSGEVNHVGRIVLEVNAGPPPKA